MPWSWRYEGVDGKPVAGPAETFSSQADAESWIGQAGVSWPPPGSPRSVLVEDDRVEYRMSLLPDRVS